MGGVAVYSHLAIAALGDSGLLPSLALAGTSLEEDHIFALALRSIGFALADFGTEHDDLPFGVKHVGLPAHPDMLLAKGKALIHSTKRYEDLDERQIRAIFAAARRRQLDGASCADVGPSEGERLQAWRAERDQIHRQ